MSSKKLALETVRQQIASILNRKDLTAEERASIEGVLYTWDGLPLKGSSEQQTSEPK